MLGAHLTGYSGRAVTLASLPRSTPMSVLERYEAPNGADHPRCDVRTTDVMAHIRRTYEQRKTVDGWGILVRRDDDRE